MWAVVVTSVGEAGQEVRVETRAVAVGLVAMTGVLEDLAVKMVMAAEMAVAETEEDVWEAESGEVSAVARVASVAAKAGSEETMVVVARAVAAMATVRAEVRTAEEVRTAVKVDVVGVVEGEDRLGAEVTVAEAAAGEVRAVVAVLNHSWP